MSDDYTIEQSYMLGWVANSAELPEIVWYADGWTTLEAAMDRAKETIGTSRECAIAIAPVTIVTHKNFCMTDRDIAERDGNLMGGTGENDVS